MPEDKTSPEWSIASVVQKLRAKARPGEGVSAQVFLKDDIEVEDIPAVVHAIVKAVRARVKSGIAIEVGKIHRHAKSFSVTADPDTVAAIAQEPAVKTILPSEIEDVFPKPVKREKS
jgi:hypothetical protein